MQTIYIDISNKSVIPCIQAKQGDVGRKFLLILTDSAKPYIIPDNALLSVFYDGKSGKGNYSSIGEQSAFFIDENKVEVELITQMLTNPGRGEMAVVLNSENGDQISVWNMEYNVESVPGIDSEEAKTHYTALSEVASQAAEYATRAENSAEQAENSAQQAEEVLFSKQNKLAWATDADIDAMFDGTYEGVENEDPEGDGYLPGDGGVPPLYVMIDADDSQANYSPKEIYDHVENGGMAYIFDVNTGAWNALIFASEEDALFGDSSGIQYSIDMYGFVTRLERKYATQDYVDNAVNGSVLYTPQTLTEEQKKQARENIGATSSAYMKMVCPHTDFDADDFIQGDAQFWSSTGNVNTGVKYRVSCQKEVFYKFARPVYIKAQDGFRFSIGYYIDGAQSDQGWATEKVIPSNQQFRIMIARVTEDTSEQADVAEFVSKVSILTEHLLNLTNRLSAVETKAEQLPIVFPPKPFEILSINHRGFNTTAPENTLAAFKLSKENGFDFVETDIRFTSDGVPVLLHDASINRTARNADGTEISETVNISDITYETALTYDFGIWKGTEYAGTKIPTLTEFLMLCRALSLHPYLDVYVCDATKAQTLYDTIANCNMLDNVTLISSSVAYNNSAITWLAKAMPKMRYGIVTYRQSPEDTTTHIPTIINRLRGLGVDNLFLDIDVGLCDVPAYISFCKEWGIPLEAYGLTTAEGIIALDPYITGVTDDSLLAKDVLKEAYLA